MLVAKVLVYFFFHLVSLWVSGGRKENKCFSVWINTLRTVSLWSVFRTATYRGYFFVSMSLCWLHSYTQVTKGPVWTAKNPVYTIPISQSHYIICFAQYVHFSLCDSCPEVLTLLQTSISLTVLPSHWPPKMCNYEEEVLSGFSREDFFTWGNCLVYLLQSDLLCKCSDFRINSLFPNYLHL